MILKNFNYKILNYKIQNILKIIKINNRKVD